MSHSTANLQDYIAAIPEPFITGSGLLSSTNYSSLDCGIIENSAQCAEQLIQISAQLYIPQGI